MNEERLRTVFIIILLVAISAAFVAMIRQFLLTLLFAAIFSGLAYPFFKRILAVYRGRKTLASLTTLLILFLVIIVPLLAFLGVLVSQTIQITETAAPWIQRQIDSQGDIAAFLEKIPAAERLAPYREELLTKLGQVVGVVGNFLVNSVSTATMRTVAFFFNFFLMLYAMFFFLKDGDRILEKILHYIPLSREDEASLVDKFLSVSRATIKGTLIIGIAQGSLAGLAFAVLGVQGAVFWGTLMTILSIIPGLGTALVWVPAAVYLAATGHLVKAWILALFCAGIVGGADNFLRPRLVGQDIQMHDLLVLLATIGGLLLFGLLGFIIGPILAALFITIWDIFGILFREKTADQ
jgi:predicted PurR-regulated permease PerM